MLHVKLTESQMLLNMIGETILKILKFSQGLKTLRLEA